MSQFKRQTIALGMVVAGSAALYFARPEWLLWALMGVVGIGMSISIPGKGGR